ncbi:MAG: glycosyl hydrolase [Fimbriimonadaceae bacterium]|nr:glycosyl hydrolase [Chitinophagales bacterium]
MNKQISTCMLLLLFLSVDISAQTKKTTTQKASEQKTSTEIIPTELYDGLQWRNIGPWRSGRSCAVSGVVGNNKIYYAGFAGGGIFKTEDGGQSWKQISDTTFHSASCGAITVAQNNPNILYAGMGEVEMRGNTSFGDGVYKSIDAGKTWKHIGLKESYAIGEIAVHPQNENVVYVAAQGNVWKPNKERGLYRTADGGNTWNLILKGINDSVGCVDVKMDPLNPNVIYASMYKAGRTPYSLNAGGKGCGLYKSIDGGNTFKLVSENPGMPKGLMGKINITISSINQNHIWASVENKDNGGIYKSTDGGETWNLLTADLNLMQRPWYFNNIYVDPKNDNELHCMQVYYLRSIDGGNSFSGAHTITWDNHVMWINPNDPDNFIIGGDGGPTVTFDDGKNWSDIDIPTAQFYHVNIDNVFPYNLYGGQQDNTSIKIKSRTSNTTIDEKDWRWVAGGEAGFIVPDPLNNKITYGGEYDGIMSTFNEDNDMYRFISVNPEIHYGDGAISAQKRFNWTFPIAISPHNPKCLYATSNYVHRSFDGGNTWETISPDLTRHDPKTLQSSGGPVTKDNTGVEFYATIFAFAESYLEPGILWTGSDDGFIHLSKDNGITWTNVTPTNLPEWSMISFVEPSHFDPGTCYISATRYKLGDTQPYIFKTNDYGKTWTKIINGLPIYNRCVRNDPNKKGILYAGLETGVYISFDDGKNWQSLQLNLPTTPVTDIQIHKDERDIAIATHGRSFWILDDITPLYELADLSLRRDTTQNYLYEIHEAYRTSGEPWTGEIADDQSGQSEPVGVKVRYYLADTLQDTTAQELKIIFYEADGDTIITYSSIYDKKKTPLPEKRNQFYKNTKKPEDGKLNAQKGMHEFIWDMRYPDATADTSAIFDGTVSGPLAVPGNYTTKLFIGDSLINEQKFIIKKDHRNPATQQDLQAQFDLSKKINDKVTEISKATKQIRTIREQIKTYLASETDSNKVREFKKISKPLIDSLNTIGGELYNETILAFYDNLKYPVKIEEKLTSLNSFLQTADSGPTKSMTDKYNDLSARADTQLAKLKKLIDENVAALNKIAGEQKKSVIEVE